MNVNQERSPNKTALRRDHMAQAWRLWSKGQAGEAEMVCLVVLSSCPGAPEALHLLGVMAFAAGRRELAIKHLAQACAHADAPAPCHADLAEIYRQCGQRQAGEAAGRRAVARDAGHAGGWNNLGIILQETGRFTESRACFERALALTPRNAQTHNNYANTCRRLGLVSLAERHWRAALTLKPDYAEPHSNLISLLADQGHYEQAIAHGQRALAINPRLADAYINLASVEMARQRHEAALRWLDRLLSVAPGHALGLAARALALKKLDRLVEAVACAAQALKAAPANAEAWNAYGLVAQARGQFDEAQAAFGRAASMPGVAAEQALINQGILFMETGEAAAAAAALDRAVAAFPRSASAWFNRADQHRFAAGDPAIPAMQALLTRDAPEADRILLHFALGKAFLDHHDGDRAFAHLHEGNRLKRAAIDYDAARTASWLARIQEVFSADMLARHRHAGAPSALPVFVIGMPRSGTTLVEQILASHPAISGAGELSHVQTLARETGFPDEPAVSGARLRALGETYLRHVTPLAQTRAHVVDKMPINFVYAGLIHLMLPGARIIHCRRDPADTCLSCYTKLFTAEQAFSYDLTELGQFHRAYQTLTARWRAVLPEASFLEVDYEAVVADVEGAARRMVGFLGLAWDPACLNFHASKRPVRTASLNQVRKPIYSSSMGRWRQYAAHLQPLLDALEGGAADFRT